MIWFIVGLVVGFILGEINASLRESTPTTQDIIVGWKK